ncbi:hypothetical protein GONAM_10_01630 [Gordonia namibiensis NBRC 108229]|uniref:FAD-binding FR-type domain-containing protein n=1 Tax=Gordonia namibiensis NBRC 108229 TaxID=1208314 RepID=K6X5M1_9ACTN|nr:hypothetical protein [Gordonia namibiensis]GAB99692.1 hypothetical protein GONAM_10_01630 [Gordonia namibiensis NBRC 108229]
MPTAPALVGRFAEALMGRRACVLATEQIAPDFLEVEFRAEPPPGGWQPGHEVQVRATRTEGRRYTVHGVVDAQRITILTVLHGDAPGTRWLRALRPGTEITLLAGKHVAARLPGTRLIFLGDGSALGTFNAHTAVGHGAVTTTTVIEAPPGSVAALSDRCPGYRILPALDDEPGATTQAWLDDALRNGDLADVDGALLLGHAQSIQQQRRALITGTTLDRRAITTRPYWATGKAGL